MEARTAWSGLRIAASMAFVAIIAACTVPVDYERETGVDVQVAVEGDIEPVLAGLRSGPWAVASLQIGAMAGPYREISALLLGADHQQASQINAMPGVSSLQVAAHAERASGTLVGMMVDRFFSVEIDVAGQSEEEINAAVMEALSAQGFEGEISVHRDEAGHIQVDASDIPSAGDGRTQLRIGLIDRQAETEDEFVHEGHLPALELGDVEGKTADEIRALVEAQLAEQGIEAGAIKVQVHDDDELHSETVEKQVEIRVVMDEEESPAEAE